MVPFWYFISKHLGRLAIHFVESKHGIEPETFVFHEVCSWNHQSIPRVNTVNFALLVNYKEDFPNEDLQVVGLSLNNILDQAIDY